MKIIKTLSFVLIALFSITTMSAQQISSTPLKTLDNQSVDILDYIGKGKATIVTFWATWCTPCKRELDAIHEVYEDWKKDYDVEVVAITTDNTRGLRKVPGLVASKGWEFIVLSDVNGDLKRGLNFQAIPQSYLIDKEGNIVYSHSGYAPGDEYELEDKLKALKK